MSSPQPAFSMPFSMALSPSPSMRSSAATRVSRRSRPPLSNLPSSPPPRASSPRSKRRYISRFPSTQPHSDPHTDPFWDALQAEARHAANEEPLLASFLFSTILNHPSLNHALAFHLANKLASPVMPSTMLMRLFLDIIAADPEYGRIVRLDLLAFMERDPACVRFIDPLLYFKGFHALQAYRIAHQLWNSGRIPLAYHLQSQVSKELQVDIHPAAQIGGGAFLDHATGIVIGETAVIGDNVSMLHHVTLGGSGKKHGQRHPHLGDGVLVGAGATILGNVKVGDGAQIGACSLVLEDVPEGSTVVGVPAKVVSGRRGTAVPALDMKHERCLEGCNDEGHGHSPSTNTAGSEVERVEQSLFGNVSSVRANGAHKESSAGDEVEKIAVEQIHLTTD